MTVVIMLLLILLLLYLQRKLYRKYWDTNLDLKLDFSAREAFEGETLTLREEVTNAKLLPLPWVAAKFQVSRNLLFTEARNHRISDDYYQNDIFSVSTYQRITRRQEFVCGKRGYYRIKSADLASSDIFIREKLVRRVPCSTELTVFPKLIPFGDMEILYRQIFGEIEVRRFTNADPFAFRGIREYQPDDDFRLINFKATAKTGQLMVNINSPTASQDLIILLNLQPYGAWTSSDVYEEGIRLAASAADYFIGLGLSVGLISNGRDAESGASIYMEPGNGAGHLHNIWEHLARIDLTKGQEPMAPLLAGQEDDRHFYLIISSDYAAGMQEAFETMLERDLSCHWILPYPQHGEVRLGVHPQITMWEVEPHAKKTSIA